jgi:hypothetical protein
VSESNIVRIKGKPEEWLREFVSKQLAENSGRIYGVCLHMEVLEPDGETSGCTTFIDWPSSAQLQGRLQTTITEIAMRHLGKP